MKLTAIAVMAAAAAGSASARRLTEIQFTTPVCMETLSGGQEFGGARIIATGMFSRIGVRLEWHRLSDCPPAAIRISLSLETPSDLKPRALAYAMPFDGSRIVVFLDRVRDEQSRDREPMVLAYVIVHELTHILEGISRHSGTGLMMAHWNVPEYRKMASGEFTFAEEDIDLIHRGLAKREAVIAESASVPRPVN